MSVGWFMRVLTWDLIWDSVQPLLKFNLKCKKPLNITRWNYLNFTLESTRCFSMSTPSQPVSTHSAVRAPPAGRRTHTPPPTVGAGPPGPGGAGGVALTTTWYLKHRETHHQSVVVLTASCCVCTSCLCVNCLICVKCIADWQLNITE